MIHIMKEGYFAISFCGKELIKKSGQAPYIEHHLNSADKPDNVCDICWLKYLEKINLFMGEDDAA